MPVAMTLRRLLRRGVLVRRGPFRRGGVVLGRGDVVRGGLRLRLGLRLLLRGLVGLRRVGPGGQLGRVRDAVAVGVLGAVGHAVVVAVGLRRVQPELDLQGVGQPVGVGIGVAVRQVAGRRARRVQAERDLDLVGEPVAVGVDLAVGHAGRVGARRIEAEPELGRVREAVVVRVAVAVGRGAEADALDRVQRERLLDRVRDAVAVDVVGTVGDAVAVRVGDVRVAVDDVLGAVREAVGVGVGGRVGRDERVEVVAGLPAVRDAVVVGVGLVRAGAQALLARVVEAVAVLVAVALDAARGRLARLARVGLGRRAGADAQGGRQDRRGHDGPLAGAAQAAGALDARCDALGDDLLAGGAGAAEARPVAERDDIAVHRDERRGDERRSAEDAREHGKGTSHGADPLRTHAAAPSVMRPLGGRCARVLRGLHAAFIGVARRSLDGTTVLRKAVVSPRRGAGARDDRIWRVTARSAGRGTCVRRPGRPRRGPR